jgi:hypothetical protein
VHLHELARAGALVQEVDVLRDDGAHEAARLELRQCAMRVVRLGLSERAVAQRVEGPDLFRIGVESVDRRVLHRVVLRPDSGRRAEVGNAALGRHASAGEDDARLADPDQRRERRGVAHVPSVGGVGLTLLR